MFRFGGSFGGWKYGAAAYGGDPDDNGNVGPAVNDYSSFAGVFGTGVYVTGVAGTSTNGVGVYGQFGDADTFTVLNIAAGVFGAANNTGVGVLGWSAGPGQGVTGVAYGDDGVSGHSGLGNGVTGVSEQAFGVFGQSGTPGPTAPTGDTIAGVFGTSDTHRGVIGTSNEKSGVYGYSTNANGVVGMTGNPAASAGVFYGDVRISGNIYAANLKSAVVPFPDGSHRALYCMESPDVWFEDFGAARLKRGQTVVRLDADFAKVIKRGDYRVFVTPEGNCHGLYVHRKSANSFEVRELMGGKSSIAFSYRIVGRRKDIKQQRRFPKIDMPLPPPTNGSRPPRKPQPTAAGLRAFIARVEKEARERAPKGAEKARARMRTVRARALRG
jgi:hypothetical protein